MGPGDSVGNYLNEGECICRSFNLTKIIIFFSFQRVPKTKKPEEPSLAKDIVVQIREFIGHLSAPTLICTLFLPSVFISFF